MSFDAKLDELIAAVNANTEALKQIDQNHQRLIAGQGAAIDKVEAPKATRSRKTKDDAAAPAPEPEAPAAPAEPVATASGADDASSASDDDVISAADLVAFGKEKLGALKDKDVEGYKKLGVFLTKTLPPEFGKEKLGELEDAADRKRAHFYIQRFVAGKDVDFSADYDYDADPAADGDDDFEV